MRPRWWLSRCESGHLQSCGAPRPKDGILAKVDSREGARVVDVRVECTRSAVWDLLELIGGLRSGFVRLAGLVDCTRGRVDD